MVLLKNLAKIKTFILSILFLISFCIILTASSSISVNKYFISSGETLKIKVNINDNETKDVYIGIVTPQGGIFTFDKDSNLTTRICKFGSYKKLNKTLFEYKFDIIPDLAEGLYKVILLTVPEKTDLSNYKIQQNDMKEVSFFLRPSMKRDINYLKSYFDKIKNGNLYYAYAIFEARLISVPDINLYLQADDIFLKTISKVPYTKKLFLNEAPADIIIVPKLDYSDNSSFDMSVVDLKNYEAVSDYEVYPDNYPFLNWLDRRFQTIGFTLYCQKKYNCKVTYLEKAVINYFIRKYVKKSNMNDVFILYTEDSKAYIYDNGKLYDESDNKINFNDIKTKIVLIFNENSVWYPLMDRDDSNKDDNLKQLLEAYNIQKNIPFLEDSEKEFITIIKNKLILDTQRKKDFAKGFAMDVGFQLYPHIKLYGTVNEFPSFRNDPGLIGMIPSFGTDYIRIVGSFLSPFADGVAQILKKYGYSAMSNEFHKYNTWGGDTWGCCYIDYTIDTGFRMDIGTCRDLSVYAAAIMEVAGKRWIRLHGLWLANNPSQYMHFYIYVPEDKIFIDNGYSETSEELNSEYVMFGSPYSGIKGKTDYSHIDILSTSDGYAIFFIIKNYDYEHNWLIRGTYDKTRLFELLNEIFTNGKPTPTFVEYDANENPIQSISYENGLEIIDKNYKKISLTDYLAKMK